MPSFGLDSPKLDLPGPNVNVYNYNFGLGMSTNTNPLTFDEAVDKGIIPIEK